MTRAAVLAACLLLLAACGEPAAHVAAQAPVTSVTARDDLGPGTIVGRVELRGEAPPRRPIAMGGLDGCPAEGSALTETLVVEGGRIANVLVRVKSGLPADGSWPLPAEAAVLTQTGCTFHPHVLAVRAGQEILVRNSDPTTHNVNAKPSRSRNEGFNRNHPPGSPDLSFSFPVAELSIPLRCDVHPWMQAWVHVLEHPFFAVTGPDGSFELQGLAPGSYELEAVHEWLGRGTCHVELDQRRGAEVVFTFGLPEAH